MLPQTYLQDLHHVHNMLIMPRALSGRWDFLEVGSSSERQKLIWNAFFMQVRALSKVDFRVYQREQVQRQTLKWAAENGFQGIQETCEAFLVKPAVLQSYLDRMLINVTYFFRNPECWDGFRAEVGRSKKETFRCLSAGCSRGVEPWTLSLIFHHHFSSKFKSTQVVGVDLDRKALTAASLGEYGAEDVRLVPPEYKKYIIPGKLEGFSAISGAVEPRPIFYQANLLNDSIKGMYDAVCYRNVGIYFDIHTQGRMLRKLTDALNPCGLLLLGTSERLNQDQQDALGLQSTRYEHLYRKRR